MEELMHKLDELISSGGITRRCVSLAQGTLSPDMRVNYEHGMVLGVDEFRQEQLYFLHKEYLHNCALHGYGTVAGLRVVPEAAGSGDVKLTLTTGIGIDQCGRVFVVSTEQCAFLRAWFQRQQQNSEASLEAGAKRLYVVGTYDECPDALVTIAGQPCSTGQQNQVASRIRDSFQITLRWEPPAMPTWDAIQCLAELMADVRIEPGLLQSQSDKAEIIELVRLLDDCEAVRARRSSPPTGYYPADGGYGGYGEPGEEAARALSLPAATARQDLDDIFRVWTTEVRPRLQPDLIQCGVGGTDAAAQERGVLLAAIDLLLAYDGAGNPLVTLFDEEPHVDDSGRPYLLSTQVIQQRMALDGLGSTPLAQHEFATLSVRDNQSLTLWIHHPEPLNLAGDLASVMEAFSNDTPLTGTIEAVADTENVFLIRVNEAIASGARVELRLRLNAIRVVASAAPASSPGEVVRPLPGRAISDILRPGIGRPGEPVRPGRPEIGRRLSPAALASLRTLTETRALGGSTPLLASMDLFGIDYIGRDDDTITLYTIANEVPDVRNFVTMSTRSEDLPRPELRLWFETEAPLVIPSEAVAATRIRGTSETPFAFELLPTGGSSVAGSQMWGLRPRQVVLQRGDFVRLRFNADQIQLQGDRGQPLSAALRAGQYTFVGYDESSSLIEVVYAVEVPVAGGGGISEEQVRDIIRQVRTLPLVTITPIQWNDEENLADFELWFHPQQRAVYGKIGIDNLNLRVYMETVTEAADTVGIIPVPIEGEGPSRIHPILYRIQVRVESEPGIILTQPAYARFVFPIDEGNSISNSEGEFETLRQYMNDLNIKLDGSYIFLEETGEEALVVYVRFDPLLLRQQARG